MNSILKKVITYLVLPACIAGLTYALVSSIMEPVQFEKHREYRKGIAVQRLKDIRDLQVAYKNVNGKYTADIDSLESREYNGRWYTSIRGWKAEKTDGNAPAATPVAAAPVNDVVPNAVPAPPVPDFGASEGESDDLPF